MSLLLAHKLTLRCVGSSRQWTLYSDSYYVIACNKEEEAYDVSSALKKFFETKRVRHLLIVNFNNF